MDVPFISQCKKRVHMLCVCVCVFTLVLPPYRGERDQNVLRELLGPLVQEVLQTQDLMLVTSPVEVYRAWINQTETETGEAS